MNGGHAAYAVKVLVTCVRSKLINTLHAKRMYARSSPTCTAFLDSTTVCIQNGSALDHLNHGETVSCQ